MSVASRKHEQKQSQMMLWCHAQPCHPPRLARVQTAPHLVLPPTFNRAESSRVHGRMASPLTESRCCNSCPAAALVLCTIATGRIPRNSYWVALTGCTVAVPRSPRVDHRFEVSTDAIWDGRQSWHGVAIVPQMFRLSSSCSGGEYLPDLWRHQQFARDRQQLVLQTSPDFGP